VKVDSGALIAVANKGFSRRNLTLLSGGSLRWRFGGMDLHNVTVASGPRGFSSVNLNANREYRKKLKAPGTYRLFCALHPVTMTQTVKVKPRRKK
jgi:plastocyanin